MVGAIAGRRWRAAPDVEVAAKRDIRNTTVALFRRNKSIVNEVGDGRMIGREEEPSYG
jgi:hypothetical protein